MRRWDKGIGEIERGDVMARKSYGYGSEEYGSRKYDSRKYYSEGSTAKKIDYQTDRKRQSAASEHRNGGYHRGSAAPARRYEQSPAPAKKSQERPLSKYQQREMEKESSRAKYRRMQSESMSLGYVIFLSTMVLVSAFLAVRYLNYQAEISEIKSNVHSLKSNIEVISSQNDAVSYDINAYIDINRIVDTALNELGMVMANEEQIKYFQKNVDEFMNQYADVPDTE